MREIISDFIKINLGPFLFISVAAGLCLLLPTQDAKEAIYLVIGAALTRVKRVDK